MMGSDDHQIGMPMKIDFTPDQLAILDKAIQQLPYYVAAPLMAHINKELEKQKQIMGTPMGEGQLVCPKTHQQNGE